MARPGRQRTLCLPPITLGDSNPPETRSTTTHSKEKRLLSIPKPRRTSDTRVIISAYQIEKIGDDHPVYLALYGPKGLVIFDHPYNADLVRVALATRPPAERTELPVLFVEPGRRIRA